MPSLREMWAEFETAARAEISARGYGSMHWTLQLPDPDRDYLGEISVFERNDSDGYRTTNYPMGPFLATGLTSGNQRDYRRFRYGPGGRVTIDVPIDAPALRSRFSRGLRYSGSTVSDRQILTALGVDDLVPSRHQMAVVRISWGGGATLGYALAEGFSRENLNRCCSCREVNTHACCRGAGRGYQARCSIDGLMRAGSSVCSCPGASSAETGRCAHDWDRVQVSNYTSASPSGFRSLAADDGRVLWSSSASSDVPYYLGIEWEVSGDDEQIQAGVLRTLTDTPWVNPNGEFPLVIKQDSSVEGEEICFSPMTPGAALAFPWDEMADHLGNRREPSGHGVHIHISNSAFTEEQMCEWVNLTNITLRPLAEAVARRRGSEWGRFNRTPIEYDSMTGRRTRGSFSENGRYSAVNAYTHHGTHEMRIFRSADTGEQMRAALAFMIGTAEYVRSDAFTPGASAEQFRTWAGLNRPDLEEMLMPYFPASTPERTTPTVSAGGVAPWAAAEVTTSNGGGASSFRTERTFF